MAPTGDSNGRLVHTPSSRLRSTSFDQVTDLLLTLSQVSIDSNSSDCNIEISESMKQLLEIENSDKPTKFTRFPDLPIELRLKIYRLTILEPQVVTIVDGIQGSPKITRMVIGGNVLNAFNRSRDADQIANGYRLRPCTRSNEAIFQVNHEARVEALKECKIMFKGLLHKPIYFAPERDTLLLKYQHSIDLLTQYKPANYVTTQTWPDRDEIRFLAVWPRAGVCQAMETLWGERVALRKLVDLVYQMEGLEEVVVIANGVSEVHRKQIINHFITLYVLFASWDGRGVIPVFGLPPRPKPVPEVRCMSFAEFEAHVKAR